MRILHVDTGRELRGGQRQVILLMEGLRHAGHESILLSPQESPLSKLAKEGNFEVHLARIDELMTWSRGVALVHAHDARAHTLAAIACCKSFVVSRRVAFPVRRSLVSAWKYRRPSRFLAVSNFVAMQLRSAGVRPEKIDIVYDGVQLEHVPAAWNARNPAVALASDDPQKGRDLVELAAKLAGIETVYSDDLSKDLRQASMFLYITRSEGLGSAALLSMAMGVPVIASSTGGLIEALDNGNAGLLVPNEPAAIASAISRVLRDPAVAAGLIERGRNLVAQRFTTSHLVKSTLDSYARVLAG